MVSRTLCLALLVVLAGATHAYEPIPRRLPPPGKPIPAEAKAKLEKELATLRPAAGKFQDNPLLPDVEIYLKAVDLALEFGEFYNPKTDLAKAERALATARERLDALLGAQSPWELDNGLVVRGYRSSIDGSAQPYGLEISRSHSPTGKKVPLYVWLHGRGDSNTDLHFLDDRSRKNWQFKNQLNDGIVLHPFGRQCIGYKSAGEIDVLDAINHVIKNYNVDPDRIALMGFSMGGAGAWHLGAHYADKWAVVHAGAGFVDVKRYQKLGPDKMPPAVEQTLWSLYDVPNYARNLLNIPVIAYSGEVDKQKDAADFMEEVLQGYQYKLPHLVGPGMGHKYHPDSLKEVAAFIRKALAKPKNRNPDTIHLQTRTLRYNRYAWMEITGLIRHWEDTTIDAAFASRDHLRITTKNVASLRISRVLPLNCTIHIDGSALKVDAPAKTLSFQRDPASGTWSKASLPAPKLRKSGSHPGPIDDAFLAPFLVVTPTGSSSNPALDQWADFEFQHFQSRWRGVFRGDFRVKTDREVTRSDIASYNLILFGSPESNRFMAEALKGSPLAWPSDKNHALVMIYPNEAAAGRYLVLNSGPTFREAHDRTNSLQNPKLGDWAIIDFSEPPGPERPGRIVKSGFFDETWKLP